MKQVVAAPEAARADGPVTFHYVMNRYRPFDDNCSGGVDGLRPWQPHGATPVDRGIAWRNYILRRVRPGKKEALWTIPDTGETTTLQLYTGHHGRTGAKTQNLRNS